MYRNPPTPSGSRIVSAASGPYAVEANASRPSTGTPVATVSSSFLRSDDLSGRPRILSSSDDIILQSPQRRVRDAHMSALAVPSKKAATLHHGSSGSLPAYLPCFVFQLEVWPPLRSQLLDRKSTRLNSSHTVISYAVF